MIDLRRYWNSRYASDSALESGTFLHTTSANQWFYLAKRHRIFSILKAFNIRASDKCVLDAACGSGALIHIWLESGAKEIVGYDISDKAVEISRQRFAETNNCHFEQVDLAAYSPDVSRRQFDIICVFEAIFLLTEKDAFMGALDNLCSWLKPGGCLIVSDRFPLTTMERHARLTYHARTLYEHCFDRHAMEIMGFFQQTRIFNRKIFPPRIQQWVEENCPWLLYGLDQVALRFAPKSSSFPDEIYYCLAKKSLEARTLSE